MKPFIIALNGYPGVGKDLVFKQVFDQTHGQGFFTQRFAFADKLKAEVAAAFGVTVEEVEEKKPLFRPLLQEWGTARRQLVALDYWIQFVAQKIEADNPSLAVITDLRHENEAEWVKSQGGVIVRLSRPGFGPVNDHVSEVQTATVVPDYEIINDGTPADLWMLVANTLIHISRDTGHPLR